MKKLNAALMVMLWLCATAAAQPQLSGNVSGTYGPGSYLVVGNITLATGNSMVIQPGTILAFGGFYRFDINGYLLALGTPTDSIKFIRNNPAQPWKGIRFHDSSNDSSRLEYCLISGSDSGGVQFIDANASLSHCSIRDNRAGTGGGMLIFGNSSPSISHCLIQNNRALLYWAGGIYIGYWGCSPTISDCIIADNRANHGAGIVSGHDCLIFRCKIERNVALYGGGGIHIDQTDATIAYCTIRENSAYFGAGIEVYKGLARLDHCLIAGNTASWAGGGIADDMCGSLITHCTIVGNRADSYGSALFGAPTMVNSIVAGNQGASAVCNFDPGYLAVKYCDFHANETGNFYNCPPAMGVKVAVNPNGDSCDVFNNIFEDPLFEEPSGGNFHLTWANFPIPDSTMSPCIDAGSPARLDPDGTVADMGAFYFDQNGSDSAPPPETAGWHGNQIREIIAPEDKFLVACLPNPFNPSTALSFDLPIASFVNLAVFDIFGRLVATLADGWREAGVHEVTFDGSGLPSGIYLYRLSAGEFTSGGKMVLMK